MKLTKKSRIPSETTLGISIGFITAIVTWALCFCIWRYLTPFLFKTIPFGSLAIVMFLQQFLVGAIILQKIHDKFATHYVFDNMVLKDILYFSLFYPISMPIFSGYMFVETKLFKRVKERQYIFPTKRNVGLAAWKSLGGKV